MLARLATHRERWLSPAQGEWQRWNGGGGSVPSSSAPPPRHPSISCATERDAHRPGRPWWGALGDRPSERERLMVTTRCHAPWGVGGGVRPGAISVTWGVPGGGTRCLNAVEGGKASQRSSPRVVSHCPSPRDTALAGLQSRRPLARGTTSSPKGASRRASPRGTALPHRGSRWPLAWNGLVAAV